MRVEWDYEVTGIYRKAIRKVVIDTPVDKEFLGQCVRPASKKMISVMISYLGKIKPPYDMTKEQADAIVDNLIFALKGVSELAVHDGVTKLSQREGGIWHSPDIITDTIFESDNWIKQVDDLITA